MSNFYAYSGTAVRNLSASNNYIFPIRGDNTYAIYLERSIMRLRKVRLSDMAQIADTQIDSMPAISSDINMFDISKTDSGYYLIVGYNYGVTPASSTRLTRYFFTGPTYSHIEQINILPTNQFTAEKPFIVLPGTNVQTSRLLYIDTNGKLHSTCIGENVTDGVFELNVGLGINEKITGISFVEKDTYSNISYSIIDDFTFIISKINTTLANPLQNVKCVTNVNITHGGEVHFNETASVAPITNFMVYDSRNNETFKKPGTNEGILVCYGGDILQIISFSNYNDASSFNLVINPLSLSFNVKKIYFDWASRELLLVGSSTSKIIKIYGEPSGFMSIDLTQNEPRFIMSSAFIKNNRIYCTPKDSSAIFALDKNTIDASSTKIISDGVVLKDKGNGIDITNEKITLSGFNERIGQYSHILKVDFQLIHNLSIVNSYSVGSMLPENKIGISENSIVGSTGYLYDLQCTFYMNDGVTFSKVIATDKYFIATPIIDIVTPTTNSLKIELDITNQQLAQLQTATSGAYGIELQYMNVNDTSFKSKFFPGITSNILEITDLDYSLMSGSTYAPMYNVKARAYIASSNSNFSNLKSAIQLLEWYGENIFDIPAIMANRGQSNIFIKISNEYVLYSNRKLIYRIYNELGVLVQESAPITSNYYTFYSLPLSNGDYGGELFYYTVEYNGRETIDRPLRLPIQKADLTSNIDYLPFDSNYLNRTFYNFLSSDKEDASLIVRSKLQIGNLTDLNYIKKYQITLKEGSINGISIEYNVDSMTIQPSNLFSKGKYYDEVKVRVFDGYVWSSYGAPIKLRTPDVFIEKQSVLITKMKEINKIKIRILNQKPNTIYTVGLSGATYNFTLQNGEYVTYIPYSFTYNFTLKQTIGDSNGNLINYEKIINFDNSEEAGKTIGFLVSNSSTETFAEQLLNEDTGSPIGKFKVTLTHACGKPASSYQSVFFKNQYNKATYFAGQVSSNLSCEAVPIGLSIGENFPITTADVNYFYNEMFKGKSVSLTETNILTSPSISSSSWMKTEYIFSFNDVDNTKNLFKACFNPKPINVSLYNYRNGLTNEVIEPAIDSPVMDLSTLISVPIIWKGPLGKGIGSFMSRPKIVFTNTNDYIYKKLDKPLIDFVVTPNDRTDEYGLTNLCTYYYVFCEVNGKSKLIDNGIVSSLNQKNVSLKQNSIVFNMLEDQVDAKFVIVSVTKSDNGLYTNNLSPDKITSSTTLEDIKTLLGRFYDKNIVEKSFLVYSLDIITNPTNENAAIHFLPITNDSMPVFSLNTNFLNDKKITKIEAGLNANSLESLQDTFYIPREDLLNKSHQRVFFKLNDIYTFDVMTFYDIDCGIGFFPNIINFTKKEKIQINIPNKAFIKYVRIEILNKFGENINQKDETGNLISSTSISKTILLDKDNKMFELDIRQFKVSDDTISERDIFLDDGTYIVRFLISNFENESSFIEAKVSTMNVQLEPILIDKIDLTLERKTRNNIINEE